MGLQAHGRHPQGAQEEKMVTLKIKKLNKDLSAPAYATEQAAGLDLCAAEDCAIHPGEIRRIPTGLCLEIPAGLEGQVRPRSGLSSRGIVAILGTVDSDYRGEVSVMLENRSRDPWRVRMGDRIAQLVIAPVMRVHVVETEELSETERGEKGFGSTGLRPQVPRTHVSEGDDSGAGEIGDSGAASAAEGVQP